MANSQYKNLIANKKKKRLIELAYKYMIYLYHILFYREGYKRLKK
jgi:hypothetical protein